MPRLHLQLEDELLKKQGWNVMYGLMGHSSRDTTVAWIL
jgi:hypothetical protein